MPSGIRQHKNTLSQDKSKCHLKLRAGNKWLLNWHYLCGKCYWKDWDRMWTCIKGGQIPSE